jgi:hypothetical protein
MYGGIEKSIKDSVFVGILEARDKIPSDNSSSSLERDLLNPREH